MEDIIRESIFVKTKILEDIELQKRIILAANACTDVFKSGGKVLLCGNGGSAADAQHIAAELSGRFNYDRPPLFAEALHVNSSFVTAVANDYSYDVVFSRMLQAMGREGDILIGISTSGNSAVVLNAMAKARELNIKTIGLTGLTGGKLQEVTDILLNVPSEITARIQESHILIGHILCDLIEKAMFPLKND
jgi:D-sedoheptulose 7-phosphate isomerase